MARMRYGGQGHGSESGSMGGMEFCLLGPLVVRCGGTVVVVRRGHQRAVLAALLLHANRPVTMDALIETLWEASPPPSAEVTIRNYVSRLRQALGEAGQARISAHPTGYLMRVDTGELDVAQFEDQLEAARAAARSASWDQVATHAGEALALWRGEPLTDVVSVTLSQRQIPRLAEMRLQALETRIDADLHLGRHADVTPELQRLVCAHPLREPLHALLMLALFRDAGRARHSPRIRTRAGRWSTNSAPSRAAGSANCTNESWLTIPGWPSRRPHRPQQRVQQLLRLRPCHGNCRAR